VTNFKRILHIFQANPTSALNFSINASISGTSFWTKLNNLAQAAFTCSMGATKNQWRFIYFRVLLSNVNSFLIGNAIRPVDLRYPG